MLAKTDYTVNEKLLQEAIRQLPGSDFRTTLNHPTGDFFYDPWEIKEEFKGSVWHQILSTIKEPIGEARVIILKPQMSYHVHSDIDDRFHLNIQCEESFLIDFTLNELHKLKTDGIWYLMDAGRLHTASNFGRFDRVQFVVRKNLIKGNLSNSRKVKILSNIPTIDDSRFVFDNTVSPWLNRANKKGIIDKFTYTPTCVSFNIEEEFLQDLISVLGNNFRIEI